MTDPNKLSRVDRHSKRRNNRVQLIVLGVLAILCLILLISLMVKGDKKDSNENETKTENVVNNENEPKNNEDTNMNEGSDENDAKNESNNEPETNEEEEAPEDGIIKKEDYPDDLTLESMHTTDENVDEAFVADWPAIGTNQTGTHNVNFENDSIDRQEIKRAITYVTDLTEDDMIEHWVGNGGDQKVIATVSDKNQDKKYKVYLQWEIEKGWKPTKVEKLKSISSE